MKETLFKAINLYSSVKCFWFSSLSLSLLYSICFLNVAESEPGVFFKIVSCNPTSFFLSNGK